MIQIVAMVASILLAFFCVLTFGLFGFIVWLAILGIVWLVGSWIYRRTDPSRL